MDKYLIILGLFWCSGRLLAQENPGASIQIGWHAAVESHMLGIGAGAGQVWNRPLIHRERTGPGISTGVVVGWTVRPGISLRQELGFAFNRNIVRFPTEDGGTFSEQINFAEVELPLHLVLGTPSRRSWLVDASFLAGCRVGWDISPGTSSQVGFKRERLSLDIGMGIGIPLGSDWVVRPEVIYIYGLNNLHYFSNLPYDDEVGRMQRDRLLVRLLFNKRRKVQ